MKIGIFYDNLTSGIWQGKDCKEVLPIAKEVGIEYLEMNWVDLAAAGPDFARYVHSLGMAFAVYLFTDENGITLLGSKAEDELVRMKEYGIENLLMVYAMHYPAGADKNVAKAKIIKSLRSLTEKATAYGIKVTFEDFDNNNIPCGGCTDLLAYAAEAPGLSFTFDTGNFIFFGENLMETYPLLKEKIVHVHVKDRTSLTDLTPCVPGQGCLPLADFLHALCADGYDGRLSIEMFGAPMSRDALTSAVSFIKTNFQAGVLSSGC